MTSAQVVETSVNTNNSPSQDYGFDQQGDKHTISTLLIKPIFSVLAHAEKQFFSKLVFSGLHYKPGRSLKPQH